jgi:hypothetical protein
MKQFKISAKNLAQLNNENTCLRCFWNLLQLRHRTPFNIFPSIFSTFDSFQKQLVENAFEKTGKFPKWLGDMADAVGLADSPPRMEHIHQRTNIVLVGIPDHVFEWKDGSVSPIDYKTARYSKGQDSLKPLYEAQLDAYSFLLDAKSSLKSEHGALVYFEPTGADTMTLTDSGYVQPWQVHVSYIDVSGETTLELLDLAREIYEQQSAPDGRAECLDCELLEKVANLAEKQGLKQRDALRFMTQREQTQYLAQAQYQRKTAKLIDSRSTNGLPADKASSLLLAWDWKE